MKGIRKTLTIALALALVFAGSAMAGRFGHHGMGGPGGHSGGMGRGFGLMGLDLSDTQKAEVAKVIESHQEERNTLMGSLAEAKTNLDAVIHADAFDEANVRQASQQVSSVKENLAVLRATTFSEIKPILTSEQLQTLNERRAERAEKMKERMEHKQAMHEKWLESIETDSE